MLSGWFDRVFSKSDGERTDTTRDDSQPGRPASELLPPPARALPEEGQADDLVAVDDVQFDTAMRSAGFVREHRDGQLLVGYYHPAHPGYGFQQVSGRLFDGATDPAKLMVVVVAPDGSISSTSVGTEGPSGTGRPNQRT